MFEITLEFFGEIFNSISSIDLIYILITMLSLIKCYSKGFSIKKFESDFNEIDKRIGTLEGLGNYINIIQLKSNIDQTKSRKKICCLQYVLSF